MEATGVKTEEPKFNQSSLNQRTLFKDENSPNDAKTEDNLYPNCDTSVWLRSCEEEITEPLQGKIFGQIPKWINGCLLRNGPGSLKVGTMEFKHLFDSSALLHRFAIKSGNVTYQCRFLQSDVYKKNHAAQRIVVTEFGTCAVPDPCQTIFHRVAAIFDTSQQSDNAMISVYPFGDEMYAFTEGPIIHRINKHTLETEGKVDVSKYVAIINHTSHPQVMNNGTVYNLGMSVTKTGLTHNIIRFPAKNQCVDSKGNFMFNEAKVVASVPARWSLHPSYMHTFGMTKNYFIIVEQPLSISVPAVLLNKIKNEPMIANFRWYNNETTQLHVINRQTGKTVKKYYADAFFYLHIINQYENFDYIIIDICCYKDPSMLDCMYIEAMKQMQKNPNYAQMFRGRPFRFVLPLQAADKTPGKNLVSLLGSKAEAYFKERNIFVQPEQLCNLGCETPRIHYEKYLGEEYRFFYAISSDVDSTNPGTIIKVDTINKTTLTWCEKNCYPSEPIFVPHPNSKFEDDGIILSAMVWGRNQSNEVGLLVLDAATFQELGRAVFTTKSPVPKCLHGWFSADS